MSIVSYLVIALALGLVNMILFRRCGEVTPVRLSAGLLIAASVAAIHVVFYWVGAAIGSLMSLHSAEDPMMYDDFNAYIFLGMVLIVAIKMLAPYLRREPRLPVFDLRRPAMTLAMAAATGINVLLLGIGVGFVDPGYSIHKIIWPLLVACLLLGYLGLMFGRQKVELRPRRWMIVSCVLLLGVAIAAVVNAS